MYAQNQFLQYLKNNQLSAFEENIPMTIQVGMVGMNGILIASDTLWTNVAKVRHTRNSNKIAVHSEHGIVISRARDFDLSKRVANAIVSDLKEIDFPNPTNVIEALAVKECHTLPEEYQVELLIALYTQIPKLFHLSGGGSLFCCEEIKDKVIAGDNINASAYFVERFYERLPINELVPLATQLIVSARLLNPGSFAGLEIVLCDSTGAHSVSPDEIDGFEKQALRLDKMISGEIFSKLTSNF